MTHFIVTFIDDNVGEVYAVAYHTATAATEAFDRERTIACGCMYHAGFEPQMFERNDIPCAFDIPADVSITLTIDHQPVQVFEYKGL